MKPQKSDHVKTKFQVASDLGNIQKVSTDVLSFLEPLSLSSDIRFDIRLCLEEALINAMKYGNALRKELSVDLEVETSPGQIRILVEDRGNGFDIKKIKDCTEEENLLRSGGRGVHLMHHLMDEVKYNEKGNQVLLVKRLKK